MVFSRESVKKGNILSIPREIVGHWDGGIHGIILFSRDGFLYSVSHKVPYTFADGGNTLVTGPAGKEDRYVRKYGVHDELEGVWLIEPNSDEEWHLRDDGSYTYHLEDADYIGSFDYDESFVNSQELRGYVTEKDGVLTIDPAFYPNITASWTLVGQSILRLTYPDGTVQEFTKITLEP